MTRAEADAWYAGLKMRTRMAVRRTHGSPIDVFASPVHVDRWWRERTDLEATDIYARETGIVSA
jgi:hypothetical protein